MDEIFEELTELYKAARKAHEIEDALNNLPDDLPPMEFVEQFGAMVNIKVLQSQAPMYKTKEEAEEASNNPELQLIDQLDETIVKQRLNMEP